MSSNQPGTTFPIGPALASEQLARIPTLPTKPAPVELVGLRFRLIATDPQRDAEGLYEVSNGEAVQVGERSVGPYDSATIIWRYMRYGPFSNASDCKSYLLALDAPDLRLMALVEKVSGKPVGILTFMANSPANLKIEIGHIWIAPVMQGSGAIYEAVYLMLSHCFDLGYRRLEWKCDSLNERSRRTAVAIGFQFEGIQEYHMIANGHSRDTAWFRILDHEWPQVRANLEKRIGL
jgi:RimJ/RimL family protein N-acetyltransferase